MEKKLLLDESPISLLYLNPNEPVSHSNKRSVQDLKKQDQKI